MEQYLADIEVGLRWLDEKPETEDDKEEQFQERRKIVLALVERVILRRSRPPEIILKFNLSSIIQIKSQESSSLRLDLSVIEMKIAL